MTDLYETEDEKDDRAVRGRRKTSILLLVVAIAFALGLVAGITVGRFMLP